MLTAILSASPKHLALYALAAMAAVFCMLSLIRLIRHKHRARGALNAVLSAVLYVGTLLLLAMAALALVSSGILARPAPARSAETTAATTAATAATALPPQTEAPTEAPTTEPAPTTPLDNFHPHRVASSDPINWDIKWEILRGDTLLASYTRPEWITFGEPENFDVLDGVSTFRGNNYRNDPTFGTAAIADEALSQKWEVVSASLNTWTGSGWTGQPLVAKWDDATKAVMNLYPEKKEKAELVEVIYATLDGYVYFLDLEDGSKTRDPVFIGMNFKGSGSLDPRGYPLLYVGSGDIFGSMDPRMYIVSLIDGSILFEYGNRDPNAKREWCGYDGAPLISADTDTLIWGGENGLLYTFKLNTRYDQAAGTISVTPDAPVAARYTMNRTAPGRYPLGMEDSALMVGNYLYISDNAGMFFCVDINTMELIWAQDTLDDNNTTAVFEWGADSHGYLYTAPALKWSISGESGYGDIYLYKLDAQTGEILWQKPYNCYTTETVPGGVLASPALGRPGTNLEGLVFFSVSDHPYAAEGVLTALNTETGEPVWTLTMDSYSWSSPVAVYTDDGKGYILMSSFYGTLYLIDGATGDVLSTTELDGHVEASPVVYGNTAVIGTRGCRIYGIELS